MDKENMSSGAEQNGAEPEVVDVTPKKRPQPSATKKSPSAKKQKADSKKQGTISSYFSPSSSGTAATSEDGKKAAASASKTPKTPAAAKMTPAKQKRKIEQLTEEIEKMKRSRDKLQHQRRTLEANKYPIEDSLLSQVEKKDPPAPIPAPVHRVHVDDPALYDDIFMVWNFLRQFSNSLSLQPYDVEDFIDALQYMRKPSVLLSETVTALLRMILLDSSMAQQLSTAVSSDANASASSKAAAERLYNGVRLLPGKLTPNILSSLTWQAVLCAILPHLPVYKEYEQAAAVRKQATASSRYRRRSVGQAVASSKDDESDRPNLDFIFGITEDPLPKFQTLRQAAEHLVEMEFFKLPAPEKLAVFRTLCLSAYDLARVQQMQQENMSKREQLLTDRNRQAMAEKRQLKAKTEELRERAVERARELLQKQKKGKKTPKKAGNGKKKDKSSEPTPAQIQAALDEILLLEQIGVDVVVDEPPAIEDVSDDEEDEIPEEAAQDLSMQERIAARRKAEQSRSFKEDKRRRRRENELLRLQRDEAVQALEAALESEKEKSLRDAIRWGKKAGLQGVLDDGKKYVTELMKQAHKQLLNIQEGVRKASAELEFERQMIEYFVRTEPLGTDRFNNRYWMFEGDDRLFVEIRKEHRPEEKKEADAGGDDDDLWQRHAESRFDDQDEESAQDAARTALQRLIQTKANATVEVEWFVYSHPAELRRLVDALDDRGVRERALKEAIKARFEIEDKGLADNVEWRTTDNEYLGQRVRRKFGRVVSEGTVVGWLPAEANDGLALWHVKHDDGDAEDLELHEVKAGIDGHRKHEESQQKLEAMRAQRVATRQQRAQLQNGHHETGSSSSVAPAGGEDDDEHHEADEEEEEEEEMEFDADEPAFLSYKNTKQAYSPKDARDLGLNALKKQLLQKEQSMTNGLRDRGSSWAVRGGSRSAWIRTLRAANDLATVRQCLLELEHAVREVQSVDDKKDAEDEAAEARRAMEAEGWIFEPSANEYIGKKVRRFFKGHGKSDGEVIAFLPAEKNDGSALWHMEHDDGDEEDLDEGELMKGLNAFLTDAQKDPEAPEDEDEEGDEEEDEEEEDEEDEESSEDEQGARLWPSWGARLRWQEAVQKSSTVSELALALMAFTDHCVQFGVAIDLDEPASRREVALWRDRRQRRKSTNKKRMVEKVTASGVRLRARTVRSYAED